MNNSVHHKNLTHPKYRADIDGLRAIAILLVIGFHASGAKGGFIGVDIFFVISGFLISTIIFNNLDSGSFSFVEFYNRRIRRIFPALLIVMAASLVSGWFFLFDDEYKQLGEHIFRGSYFMSNFTLLQESGYFDNEAETKPLLHLWSLAVEEQFYIIWPLLLWLAWKIKFNPLKLIAAIATASFVFSLSKIYGGDKTAAFYLPQSRFWELLIGSTLAYLTIYQKNIFNKFDTKLQNITAFSGAILITIGALIINENKPFPGAWALLPTLGAFCIIAAGSQAWFNQKILQNKILIWFGLISFPLYLWHWPLLSFAKIIGNDHPALVKTGAVFAAILLAWLTCKFIEKPIRFGKNNQAKTIILIALMAVVGGAGYVCYKNNGLTFRMKEQNEYLQYFDNSTPEMRYAEAQDLFTKFRNDCDFYNIAKHRIGQSTTAPLSQIAASCFERDHKHNKSVFIWGDSHAQYLYFGLKNHLPANWQVLQVASSACEANIDNLAPSTTDHCQQSNWFALEAIKKARPSVVIVAQNLGHNINDFNKITLRLKSLGVQKIIFTGPSPHWVQALPKIVARRLWEEIPQRTFKGGKKTVMAKNSALQKDFANSIAQNNGAAFANLIDLFCNEEGCLVYFGDDKANLTTWDYGHLTPAASDYLAKNLLAKMVLEN